MSDFNNILSIGIDKLKKLSLESPHIDTNQPKKSNRVKLTFTNKEFTEYNNAVNLFLQIASNPNFISVVRSIKGQNISLVTIQEKLILPIVESVDKIKASTKTKPVQQNADTNNFFIKKRPATNKSKALFRNVQNVLSTNLKYDQRTETCISDARVMLSTYLSHHNLVIDDIYTIDQFLVKLLPGTFETEQSISKVEYRSISMTASKELVDWTPVTSKQ
jgi:hypothetical protein